MAYREEHGINNAAIVQIDNSTRSIRRRSKGHQRLSIGGQVCLVPGRAAEHEAVLHPARLDKLAGKTVRYAGRDRASVRHWLQGCPQARAEDALREAFQFRYNVHEIKIPPVGESVTSALVARWHVTDGTVVEKDQTLVTLETDKVSNELEAEVAGTVSIKVAGRVEEIGTVIGLIAEEPGRLRLLPLPSRLLPKLLPLPRASRSTSCAGSRDRSLPQP